MGLGDAAFMLGIQPIHFRVWFMDGVCAKIPRQWRKRRKSLSLVFFFYFIFGERVVALSRVLWYVCDTFDGGKHSVFIAAIRISFVPRLVRVRLKRRCWISSFFQFARMWKGCFLGVEDFRIGRLKINYYFFWIFIYSEISFLRDRNSHIYFRCLLSILSIPFRYTVIYLILAFTFIFSANYVWDIKN